MSVPLLIAGVVVLIGAAVQGVAGYGMNMVAAPLLALVDPLLVPVPLLFMASLLSTLSVAREWRDTDWRGVGWVTAGRIPGTALGVAALITLPPRPFAAAVGVAVLICVLLSVITWRPAPNTGPLVVAGLAAGTLGTAASIGGPPVALLYQHQPGPRIRATMAACFAAGTLLSLAGLWIGGEIHRAHLVATLWLVPFMVVGFALSGPARRFLDKGRMRPAVLIVAATSAVLLLVTSALG